MRQLIEIRDATPYVLKGCVIFVAIYAFIGFQRLRDLRPSRPIDEPWVKKIRQSARPS